MRIKLTIQKFNPELDPEPYDRDYFVDVHPGMTLLNALLKIKSEVDGTLTFRASCRSAICGSCAMQINGTQKLACQVSLREEFSRHQKMVIGPMANMQPIKDLVVQMTPFWDKIKAVTPYITAVQAVPSRALQGLHKTLHHADGCIMCGACLSACATYDVSPTFLGPAALAKAYRFQADPREGDKDARLASLQKEGGIWDCVRCNFCVAVCPKEVAPMEQIIRLRRQSLDKHFPNAGASDTIGRRHITQFVRVVSDEGRLNETRLPLLMMWRTFYRLMRTLPLGAKMFLRGKTPWPFKKMPGHAPVRRIFKRFEKH